MNSKKFDRALYAAQKMSERNVARINSGVTFAAGKKAGKEPSPGKTDGKTT
jgi:hypothetical protein